jgi:hypothetical protein
MNRGLSGRFGNSPKTTAAAEYQRSGPPRLPGDRAKLPLTASISPYLERNTKSAET